MFIFLKNAAFQKQITASCYPTGYSIEIPQIDFYNLCTNGEALENEYNFTIQNTDWSNVNIATKILIIFKWFLFKTQTHIFSGSSNNAKCTQDVALIVPKPQCTHSQCAFDGVYQPTVGNLTFMAS